MKLSLNAAHCSMGFPVSGNWMHGPVIFGNRSSDRVHARCVCSVAVLIILLWLQLIHRTVSTPKSHESSLLVHRISGFWKLDGPMIFDNRSGEGTCKLCCVL